MEKRPDSYNDSRLCHIHIILSEKGMEQRLASLFDRNYETENNFLYITQHQYCVEFTLEFQQVPSFLEELYEILSYIDTI